MTATRLDGSSHMRGALPLARWMLPRWALLAATSVCLTLAGTILGLTRGMVRAGLAGPPAVNRALRIAARLSRLGLQAWRGAASRTRSRPARRR